MKCLKRTSRKRDVNFFLLTYKQWMQYSKTQKIVKPHVLILKLINKLDLTIGQETIALSNLSIYYTWKSIKGSYSNYEFKLSAPTWNDNLYYPDGSHSVSDIQDYFEYIFKKVWRQF